MKKYEGVVFNFDEIEDILDQINERNCEIVSVFTTSSGQVCIIYAVNEEKVNSFIDVLKSKIKEKGTNDQT